MPTEYCLTSKLDEMGLLPGRMHASTISVYRWGGGELRPLIT